MRNWKMTLLNLLREHAWHLTPEQQVKLAIAYMLKVAITQRAKP